MEVLSCTVATPPARWGRPPRWWTRPWSPRRAARRCATGTWSGAPGDTLNTATIRPLRPLLVERVESDGVRRVAPVNLVTRYRWVSRADGTRRALRDRRPAPGSRPAATPRRSSPLLDADRSGRLDEAELRLDTPQKAELVAARLRALGVEDPVVVGQPRRAPARPRHLHAGPRAAGLRRLPRRGLPARRRLPGRLLPARRRAAPAARRGARGALRRDRAGRPAAGSCCSGTATGPRAASTCSATPGRPGRTGSASSSSSPSSLGVTRPRRSIRLLTRRKRGHVVACARGEGVRLRPLRAALALDHGGERDRPHPHRARDPRDGRPVPS